MPNTLNTFNEAVALVLGDLFHLKRGTGVNTDMRITEANLRTAIVTAAAVAAAGATLDADTDLSSNAWFLDEDNMVSDDDTKVASQQSVKAYVDTAVVGALKYQTTYDANTNTPDLTTSPNAILKGQYWVVSVSGTFYGQNVEVGDTLIAEQDDPSAAGHWGILQTNLDAATIKTLYESNADTNEFSDAEQTKLAGIEALADVTDATNVDAAGATMNADSDLSSNSWFLDEDNMVSDSAVKVPSQQSVKAYVDGAASPIGKQTLFVPAAAMRPTASNGCAALTDVETTAGRPDMTVLDFDATADEHAQFQVAFPKQWNLGTITFQVFWTTTATDADGVAWALQGVACGDGDTIDVAHGTAVVVTDDAQSAAEDMLVTAESGAVTIAGTPADDQMCFFRFFRDVSDANDDMTEDARLIGVKLFYTIDAANDD